MDVYCRIIGLFCIFHHVKSAQIHPGIYDFLLQHYNPTAAPAAAATTAASSMPSSNPDWTYLGADSGPSKWATIGFPTCAAMKQSPIDIKAADTSVDTSLGQFTFKGFNTAMGHYELENNGHTLEVSGLVQPMMEKSVSSGGLPGTYIVEQFHFHWALVNGMGSEHKSNGKQFELEMHIVMHKNTFASVGAAVAAPGSDNLAVLGVWFQLDSKDNPALDLIFTEEALSKIKNEDEKTEIDAFKLSDLLPSDLTHYARYDGSLTTPPCTETVVWTLFATPCPISQKQLDRLRSMLYQNKAGEPNVPLVPNFRPIQALNGRKIKVSRAWPTGSAAAAATTAPASSGYSWIWGIPIWYPAPAPAPVATMAPTPVVHTYAPVTMAPATPAPAAATVCTERGKFLPSPEGRCKFIRCIIQSEPWIDPSTGTIRLDSVTQTCAPGTGVPATWTGGFDNPCTVPLFNCNGVTPAVATAAPAVTVAPMTAAPAPHTYAPAPAHNPWSTFASYFTNYGWK